MKIYSLGLSGTETFTIEIEARFSRGLPLTNILGLAPELARGLKERVAAATEASGIKLPQRRSVINVHSSVPLKLSQLPSELLDLPVALLLLAAGVPELKRLLLGGNRPCFAAGELTLAGEVRPLQDWACVAMHRQRWGPSWLDSHAAQIVDGQRDLTGVPYWVTGRTDSNAPGWSPLPESWKQQITAERHIIESLAELKRGLPKRGRTLAGPSVDVVCRKGAPQVSSGAKNGLPDAEMTRTDSALEGSATFARDPFQQVCLLLGSQARLHMLFAGPPGTGKTFLCEGIGRSQKPLDPTELLELSLIDPAEWHGKRPFRKPHSSATVQSFTGGSRLQAGEFAKAHAGILFLDEIAEFSPHTLEALRLPLDEGSVLLTRARGSARFPARFQLLATMNPCPCGDHFAHAAPCRCSPSTVRRYLARLSGPLLDRLHICVWLNPPELEKSGAQTWARELLGFRRLHDGDAPTPDRELSNLEHCESTAEASTMGRRTVRNNEVRAALASIFPTAPSKLLAQDRVYLQSFRDLIKEAQSYL